jgi:hypothetical protein
MKALVEQDGRDSVKGPWMASAITVSGAYSVSFPYSTCSNTCGGSLDHLFLKNDTPEENNQAR